MLMCVYAAFMHPNPVLSIFDSGADACVFYPQVKLVHHAYSCLFGTFTCNTPQQQAAGQVQEHTLSVWSLFTCHTSKYLNLLYTPGADQV